MIFHPGIIALLLGSLLITAMLCYSAYEGARIIGNWNIRSGSEEQLEMERKTYLISTLMGYALGFQLFSLFLFIYTADSLSPLFVGAMCAAGSLSVNGFGYPATILKLVNCLLAGLWLVVNFTDNQAHDYPLIKTKYGLLLCISPLLVTETVIQGGYLLSLAPDLITSCCGTLFTTDANNVISDLIALPRGQAQTLFVLSTMATILLGLYFLRKGKGAYFFSLAALAMLLVSLAAVISFISIYFYELPTHHCPFCILHSEYGYVGYPLYFALLVGAICGLGVGAVAPFRKIESLRTILPRVQRQLAATSLLAYLVFLLIAGGGIWFSNLSMAAY